MITNLQVMSSTGNQKTFLAATFITIMVIGFLIHRQFIQVSPAIFYLPALSPNSATKSSSCTIPPDEHLIHDKVSQWIHIVSFNDTKFASSAKNSRATIINPKKTYCIGDKLTIQIDMFDYLGNRKTYGGDFIKPRIHNPTLKAGASGVVEDFNNGTFVSRNQSIPSECGFKLDTAQTV
ncbi:NXPE family member 4-like isoform X2 [Dendropsophus ebraccatus]|uniref:NXPE family member 4-like isoform X2 n=1 Tax=Dendropsophus ebraccatus TaxID=150705 RepID=UPI003831329A